MAARPPSRWLTSAGLFVACMFAATAPLWLQRAYPKWDALDLLYPAFAVLSDGLRSGRFPLWDPYTNCGYPLYADAAVSAGFNPVAILVALIVPTPSLGFVLYWIIHWAWGGLGMMFLARRHGAAPLGAFVAATAYAFSGFFVGHGTHTPFLITASWFPWSFAFADGAVEDRRIGRALLAGVALGASALAGYPTLTAFGGVALALWLALRWLLPLGEPPAHAGEFRARAAWVAITLGICAVLLAAISSPTLVAFFREGSGYTDRTGALPPEIANYAGIFPPRALSSLLFPFVTVLVPEWFPTDVSMSNAYLGLLGVPLAAIWAGARPRRRLWVFAFVLFMLLLSFGGTFGVRALVYDLVPVTRYMRHNAAYRVFWMMPLALAAGCGATLVASDPRARRAFAMLIVAWALVAVIVAALLWRFVLSPRPVTSHQILVAFGPGLGLLAGAVLVIAVARSTQRAAAAIGALLAVVFAADGAWHLHHNKLTVWAKHPYIERVEAMPKRPVAYAPREADPISPLLPKAFNAQQILRVPVVGGYVTMLSKGFNEVLLGSPFREVLLAHRFWVAPGRTPSQGEDDALQALAATRLNAPVPVHVASRTGDTAAPVPPGSYGEATVVSWKPERVALRAVAPAGGLLVSTERYAAGWTAEVSGRPATVERVNVYFVGVALPPGEHEVVLTYRGGAVWAFVALSLFSALGATLAGFALERRARRHAQRGAPGPPVDRARVVSQCLD